MMLLCTGLGELAGLVWVVRLRLIRRPGLDAL